MESTPRILAQGGSDSSGKAEVSTQTDQPQIDPILEEVLAGSSPVLPQDRGYFINTPENEAYRYQTLNNGRGLLIPHSIPVIKGDELPLNTFKGSPYTFYSTEKFLTRGS